MVSSSSGNSVAQKITKTFEVSPRPEQQDEDRIERQRRGLPEELQDRIERALDRPDLAHEQAERDADGDGRGEGDAGALQADGDVVEQRAAGEAVPERRDDRVERREDRRVDPARAAGDLPEHEEAEQARRSATGSGQPPPLPRAAGTRRRIRFAAVSADGDRPLDVLQSHGRVLRSSDYSAACTTRGRRSSGLPGAAGRGFRAASALVGGAEQAAPLQLGDDQIDEVVERAGQPGRQDVEAVGGLVLEPFLAAVSATCVGAADDGVVAARGRDPLVELADGEVVLVGDLADQRLAALHAFGLGARRQRAVERIAPEVELPPVSPLSSATPSSGRIRLGQLLVFRARLLFGAADEGRDAGHDQDMGGVAADAARTRALMSR